MADLNIDVICANTPAAKGRVERAHLTLPDRLVKELRLAGITNMEEGNLFLEGFRERHNARFGRLAREATDMHRPLLPGTQAVSISSKSSATQRSRPTSRCITSGPCTCSKTALPTGHSPTNM